MTFIAIPASLSHIQDKTYFTIQLVNAHRVDSENMYFRVMDNWRTRCSKTSKDVVPGEWNTQEPITRSVQLPYWASVTAFLQTSLFLEWFLFQQ